MSEKYEEYWQKLTDSAKYHPANRYRYFLIDEILEKILRKGMNVLDMGCGDARLVSHLKRKWPECGFYACDISQQVIEGNRQRESGIQFFQADISAQDFAQKAREASVGRVDVIISSEVIEHLENDLGLLKNAGQLLEPGGHLILTTQSGPRYRVDLELLHHLRHYDRRDLEALVRSCGFSIESGFSCGFPVLNLQKVIANLAFDTVIKAAAGQKRPSLLVRLIMATMFQAMKATPRIGGPQLVLHATRGI